MAVVKFKPLHTSHVLNTHAEKVQEDTKKTVQRSQMAVARSREIIRQSKEIIDYARKRRG